MKKFASLILFLSLALGAMAFPGLDGPLATVTDTLPPPPPGGNYILSGPDAACVGDTSYYTVDVPVACQCQWSVNGNIQPVSDPVLIMTWDQPGLFVISLVFLCTSGQVPAGSVETMVSEEPAQPGVIQGETQVCEYTIHTYSTTVGPFDTCEWKVNGIIQPSTGPSMTYSFGGAGLYTIEVTASNLCGTSIPRTQEVLAQGTAPPPPEPITGPGESCTGSTETYTANPAAGYSCLWWVDGIQQPDTASTIMIYWQEPGEHIIEARTFSDCGTSNPASIGVTVYQQPVVDLGPDTAILQGETLLLDAGNPGSTFLWSTGATTQTIQVTLAGTYSVNVDNYCGTGWDEIEVSVVTGIKDDHEFDGNLYYSGHHLFIEQGGTSIQSLDILDATGKILYSGPFRPSIPLNCSGLVVVVMRSGRSVITRKMMVL